MKEVCCLPEMMYIGASLTTSLELTNALHPFHEYMRKSF